MAGAGREERTELATWGTLSTMRQARRSRLWIGLGAAGLVVTVLLVWLGVNGVRLAQSRSRAAGPPRPAYVPAPSKALPIALWSETEDPIVNLAGDLDLGYETWPRWKREPVTARVVLKVSDERGAFLPVLQLYFRRTLDADGGHLPLGALLAAVNQQQAVSRQLKGEGKLAITLGERDEEKAFHALSNSVTVPCVFR